MVRLVTFHTKSDPKLKVGVLVKGGVIDLSGSFKDMRELLEVGKTALESIKAHMDEHMEGHLVPQDQVVIKAPIYNPEKVICIGLNYKDHAKESGMEIPPEPVFFAKYPTAIIGEGDTIILPHESKEVDYEVELVIVIGKKGRRIPEKDAYSHVVGYTVGHDVSARDFQFKDGKQWIKGKSFDTFAPIGPAIVTKDEVKDVHQLPLRTILNGQTLQNSSTSQLAFNVPKLVSYLSTIFTLNPGDLIFTGTPPGVGFARKPPIFLKDGDKVTVEVDEIGSLTNHCKQEHL